MEHSTAVQVISIMSLWVLYLSALRFAATTLYDLRPLALAILRIVRWRMSGHDRRREIVQAMDTMQFRFSIALCTPWSITLLFLGLACIGVAVSFVSGGDVMMLVARQPERWVNADRYLDWVGSMLFGLGSAAALAAMSKRRTASFLVSTGFAITGLGIGIIAAFYV